MCNPARAIVISEPRDKVEFDGRFECVILRDAEIKGEVKMEGRGSSLMIDGKTTIGEGIIMEGGSGHLCIFDSATIEGDIKVQGALSVHVCGDPAGQPKEGPAPSMLVDGLLGDIVCQARPNSIMDVEVQGAWGRVDVTNALSKASSVDVQWSMSLISIKGVPNKAFALGETGGRMPLGEVSVYMAFEGSIWLSGLHLDHGAHVQGHFANPRYGDYFGGFVNTRKRYEVPRPFFGRALMARDCSVGPQGSFQILGAMAPVIFIHMFASLDIELCSSARIHRSTGTELSVHQCLGPVTVTSTAMEKIGFEQIGFGGLVLGGLRAKEVDCSDNFGWVMDLGRGENATLCHVIDRKDGRCEYLQSCPR